MSALILVSSGLVSLDGPLITTNRREMDRNDKETSAHGREMDEEPPIASSNPKKRKYRAPDPSKHPDTITTEDSVNSLINSLYEPASLGVSVRAKLRSGAEEFTRLLIRSLLESARSERSATQTSHKGKVRYGHVRRVGADEIWKAFVEHDELKPFALRFLELGLIPPEQLKLFEFQKEAKNATMEAESSVADEETEDSDSDDFQHFLAEE